MGAHRPEKLLHTTTTTTSPPHPTPPPPNIHSTQTILNKLGKGSEHTAACCPTSSVLAPAAPSSEALNCHQMTPSCQSNPFIPLSIPQSSKVEPKKLAGASLPTNQSLQWWTQLWDITARLLQTKLFLMGLFFLARLEALSPWPASFLCARYYVA